MAQKLLSWLLQRKTNSRDQIRQQLFTAACSISEDAALMHLERILRKLDPADVNTRRFDNLTPLMLACECRKVHVVNWLLQNGANADLQDTYGQTCLRYAVRGGVDEASFKILSSLIKNGHDVNARINNDQTFLMLACERGDLQLVTLVIEHGANLDLQDQNGDTALHFAQRAPCNEFSIARALVIAGASHLCNSQGLTALLVASNKGNFSMVECFIEQPGITIEQRIDALELLGASLSLKQLSDSTFDSVELGFKYIKRGMIERFADPNHPLLKQQMKPIEAYQNKKESQTLEQLAQIEDDRNAIIMESLVIRERILGRNNEELLLPIRDVAKEHKDNDFFSLYIHANKIAHSCNQTAVVYLRYIINSLWNKWFDLVKDDVFVESFDQIILAFEQEIHVRRRMTKKQLKKSLFLKREYLMKLVWMISRINCGEDGKLSSASRLFLKTLFNFPQGYNGNTILHQFVTDHHRFPSYFCTDAMKLLLNAGFNVNVINDNGDTPLHLAVTLRPNIDMLEVLFDGGAHHDFVNSFGKTPMDMAQTDEARMILSREKRKLELKCISARAIKKFGIPYLGLVPKILEKYISMH